MPRKTTDAGTGHLLRPPTFGGLLRRLRDDRRISREKLAFAAGVSASYITHLEGGDRDHPTKAVVDALIRYLDRVEPLADAERRHLFDLAGITADTYPSVEELRADIGEDMRRALGMHEPNPACYLDTRWNLLSWNGAYAAAFPGLVTEGNVLRWFFGDTDSKRIMVEWEREALRTVEWLRGLIGQSGDTGWSADLLRELGEFPEFCDMWAAGGTAYGRDSPLMQLCDPDTGARFELDVQMFRVDSGSHPGRVQFFLGIRTGERGAVGDVRA
ncbi:helix-turn-helix transcriptional regulator [Nocardia arizonensis]|uniref:helix-turn-helix transcriptional regulator n=1 Tax=Nocardia arizonensis TaxID=1141647 RepID=UPI000AD65454|nr:helix-turn-helix transcriptional regulator [Nocardia arizonensis]